VVKLLLERNDVDPDTNADGDTPLTVAVDNGYEEVVRLLLGKDNVDPNRVKRGEAPLFRAAANGYSAIVQGCYDTDRRAKTLQCHDFLSEDSNLPRTSKIPRLYYARI
jgi:hypothetical protein